jgi:predicted ArsR family transcriptional regulator
MTYTQPKRAAKWAAELELRKIAILLALRDHGPLNKAETAPHAKCHTSSVLEAFQELETGGYVQKARTNKGRSQYHAKWVISPKGLDRLEEVANASLKSVES